MGHLYSLLGRMVQLFQTQVARIAEIKMVIYSRMRSNFLTKYNGRRFAREDRAYRSFQIGQPKFDIGKAHQY
jgi:hypothetical protein